MNNCCLGQEWYNVTKTYLSTKSVEVRYKELSDVKKCAGIILHKNQHASVFKFCDNSQFIIYKDNSFAYRNPNGFIMAWHINPSKLEYIP